MTTDLIASVKTFAGIPMAPVRETKPHINILIYGVPGAGKGHVEGTLIATPTGWEKIENLQPGRKVIGVTGKPVKVEAVYDRRILEIYTVRFHDGAETVCDEDHLWYVYDGQQHGRPRVISTAKLFSQSIRKRGSSAYRWSIPLVSPVEYEYKDLPIEPYLLGVLLANGDLGIKRTPCITTNDTEIIDRIRKRNPEVTIREVGSEKRTARGWNVIDFGWRLEPIGLRGKKAADKFIPEEYLTAHVEARQELLAGLIDCDSHAAKTASKNTARPIHWTRSQVLAEQIRILAESLGGTTTLYASPAEDGKTDFQVRIIGLAFNPYRLQRKRAVIEKSDELRKQLRDSRRIVSVEPAGKGHVYCIKVEESEYEHPTRNGPKSLAPLESQPLYVTEHYVVTHNTHLASLADKVPAMRPVLYLNIEGGDMTLRHSAPEIRKVPEQGSLSWAQLEAVYHELHRQCYGEVQSGEFVPRTVIIDTLTEMQKMNMSQIMGQLLMDEPDKNWDPDIPDVRRWGKNIEQIRRWVRRYRDLPLNVIMTCHEQEDKDNMSGLVTHKPQLSGKLSNEVAGFFDVVAYLYVKNEAEGGEAPRPVRKLLTGALEGYIAKDRSGSLPHVMLNPTMGEIYSKITKGISADKAAQSKVEAP